MAYQTFRVETTRDETRDAGAGQHRDHRLYRSHAGDQRGHDRAVESGLGGVWNSRLQYSGDFESLAAALAAIDAAHPEADLIRCYEYSVDDEFTRWRRSCSAMVPAAMRRIWLAWPGRCLPLGPERQQREGDSNRAWGPDKALKYAALVIVAGVLATTLAQPQVLARLPLQNLLKNELHVDRTANAAFFFWAGLAWYLKPFAGILTDAFPLFGSRRKSYILISATLAALSWLALIVTPHDYRKLLFVVIVINTFMVVASTVVGGYMVETAQANSGSGRLTAIRQFVQQACLVVNGPIAGYLAGIAFGWTAAACGGVMLLLVPATILFLHEQRKRRIRGKFWPTPANSWSTSRPPGPCGAPPA